MVSFKLGKEIEKDIFSSCRERKKKEKVPMRNRTSELRIPLSNALPLNRRDSTVNEVYYEVHLTRVLHTARINNVDSVIFVNSSEFLSLNSAISVHCSGK